MESNPNVLIADGLLPVRRCAEFLGVHRATVYELVKAGDLPTVRVGHAVRVPARALRGYCLDRLRTGPALARGEGG